MEPVDRVGSDPRDAGRGRRPFWTEKSFKWDKVIVWELCDSRRTRLGAVARLFTGRTLSATAGKNTKSWHARAGMERRAPFSTAKFRGIQRLFRKFLDFGI